MKYALVIIITLLAAAGFSHAESSDDDQVLVQFEDIAITIGEFKAMALRIPEEDRRRVYGDASRVLEDIDNLFVTHIMAERARQRGLDQEGQIQAQLRLFEEQLLTERYVQAYLDELPQPDWDVLIQEQYLLRQEEFVEPARAQASHILILHSNESGAKEVIQSLKTRVEQGESLEDLAREYSKDTGSAARGGQLAETTQGRFEPAFDRYVFEAPVGELSDPVRTRYGYHLIRVDSRVPARQKPLDEVSSTLRAEIEENWRTARRAEMIEALRVAPKEMNHEAIELLVKTYSPDAIIQRKP